MLHSPRFFDKIYIWRRLVEYPLDDVVFLPEGQVDNWCGVETRKCGDCNAASSNIEDYWSWCGTRTMTMRLAIRLKRLAVLTAGQGMDLTFKFRLAIHLSAYTCSLVLQIQNIWISMYEKIRYLDSEISFMLGLIGNFQIIEYNIVLLLASAIQVAMWPQL